MKLVYLFIDGYKNLHNIEFFFKAGETSERACIRRLSELVARETQFSACAISCVNTLAPDNIKE